MTSSYRPDGYTAVSPYLIVDGATKTIEFLTQVFGAVELRRFPAEDGRIIHAELRIEDTVLMVADSAQGWPPVPSHVHVYVPDVDSTFRRALDAGGEAVRQPEKKEDEDRRGGVKDPGGTTWWIATRVG